jgi:hypothetical protein
LFSYYFLAFCCSSDSFCFHPLLFLNNNTFLNHMPPDMINLCGGGIHGGDSATSGDRKIMQMIASRENL